MGIAQGLSGEASIAYVADWTQGGGDALPLARQIHGSTNHLALNMLALAYAPLRRE